MRIDDYTRLARRYAVILVLASLVGCAAGLGFSLVQTPKYSATVKMFISVQQAANLGDLAQGIDLSTTLVRSYSQAVETQLVLDPVIKSLNLRTSAADLAEQVETDSPLDTTVLEITVTDTSPARSARIANAIESRLAAVINVLTPPTADSAVPVKTTLMQSALAPDSPTTPNIRLNVALGVVVALGITVLILLVRTGFMRAARQHELENELQAELLPDGITASQSSSEPIGMPRSGRRVADARTE